MDSEVLYEICHHGLGDNLQLVATPAQDLVISLLNGKLLMGEMNWNMFMDSMKSVLPILQVDTGY